MEDQDIIALYRCRDEHAIIESNEKYGAYCGAVAMNILGSREDAEECVNDTFFAAWERIPPTVPSCLRVFLGRITRNISVSRWRASRAAWRGGGMDMLLSELEECVPSYEDTESAVDTAMLSELINGWLDSLDADSRALFVLRYWHGESVSQLAREYGRRPENVTQWLLRLRRRLKAFLGKEGIIV